MKTCADSKKTQRARILSLLVQAKGAEVPLSAILDLRISQFGARIYELRKKLGFRIVNRTERVDGQTRSWFRLENYNPTTQQPQQPETELLFELPPRLNYPD
jgi:Helix-turn-helix domain